MRRSTGGGARKACRSRSSPRASGPGSPRSCRCRPMPRTGVRVSDFRLTPHVDGRAIKIAPMIDEHTRALLLNLMERSITGEHLVGELERAVVITAAHRKCHAWIAVLSWFPKCYNGSATTPAGRCTSRQAARETTATSNPSTTVRGPRGRRRLHAGNTTTDTVTWPRATAGRASTLRRAGAPTSRSPAASTEDGSSQPASRAG